MLLLRIGASAREDPRDGYRRIRALLVREGWSVDLKRVHRLGRREGLEGPQVQRRRRRPGPGENRCARRRAERPDHVGSDDFIHEPTADGRGPKRLPVVDEFTRRCRAIEVARPLTAEDVVATQESLFEVRGEPESLRGANGPGFLAEAVRRGPARRGSKTRDIAPGSPRENASRETFKSRPRDELPEREPFQTPEEAKVILEDHRPASDPRRPHSSSGDRTPAEFAAAQTKPGVAAPAPADPILSRPLDPKSGAGQGMRATGERAYPDGPQAASRDAAVASGRSP